MHSHEIGGSDAALQFSHSSMGDQAILGYIFRMFHVSWTAPPAGVALESLTVPLSHAHVTVWGPLNWLDPCLRLGSRCTIASSPTLHWWGNRVAFSRWLFWQISFCFQFLMYCQLASKDMFNNASRLNTSWVGVVVVCTVLQIAWRTADSTPVQPQCPRSRASGRPID